MNKATTLVLLRSRFQRLEEVEPNLVRAERQHKGNPFGIYYFDFTQSVARPEFNLKAFVQQQIASDFYKHEGSLQWNYYLYFVLDSGVFESLDTPKITSIESDRTFARKFVRDSETLNSELQIPLSAALQASKVTQDIASRWVKALGDAGLAGIADPSADYLPTIRHYLERTTSSSQTKAWQMPQGEAENGQFVQRIELGNFRQHPILRDFSFGRVNLIRGPNGTGKTSLLEAIELCICGANRRHQGNPISETKLRLQFMGQDRSTGCPSSNAKLYRDRDRSWYGGYYLQGNRLCENFARFNFFDTDAAVQLSSQTNVQELQAAMETLFLGQFANSIEERMKQSHERFKRELQSAQKELKVHRSNHRKMNEDMAQLQAIKDTRETLAEELRSKATICNWKKLPARITFPVIESLQESVAAESESFSQAIRRIPWMPKLTLATLENACETLTEATTALAKSREIAQANAERAGECSELTQALEAELEVIGNLRRYHDEPSGFLLLGRAEEISALRGNLDRFREAAKLLRGLNTKPFEESMAAVPVLIELHRTEISKRSRILGRLKNRASDLQNQLGKIKGVVDQIKGLGKHFCEVSPDAKSCPLCGTEFANLRTQLTSIQIASDLESPLRELSAQIAREENELSEAETTLETLDRLHEAEQLITFPSKPPNRSAKMVLNELAKLPETIASNAAKLEALVAAENRLRNAGLTESQLGKLLKTAVNELDLPRNKLEKQDSLRVLQTERLKEVQKLQEAAKKRAQADKATATEIRRWHVKLLGPDINDNPDTEIQRRQSVVEDVLSSIRSNRCAVEFDKKDEFETITARLDIFVKAIARIHQAFKRVEERDALEHRLAAGITETMQAIAKLEPRETRAKEAIALLDELLGSDYKHTYLNDMLLQQSEKLVALFTRIHSPHEFSDVLVHGGVKLKRETGSLSSVEEISTGQRTALALSIFLSLNSSVSSRAPWLIFDDPIAHVDDLNILSFLDILRDVVLLGDRQVFFATANQRIADLFARKFDCLGSDFKDIPLKR